MAHIDIYRVRSLGRQGAQDLPLRPTRSGFLELGRGNRKWDRLVLLRILMTLKVDGNEEGVFGWGLRRKNNLSHPGWLGALLAIH